MSTPIINVSVTGNNIPSQQYKTVILKPNLVDDVNTLTQTMLDIHGANTKFVIKYNFTLAEDITVPSGCILEFDGGSISGAYTITGNNIGINAGLVKIFNTNITLAGSWNVAEAYPEWFGAVGDFVTDDIIPMQKCLNVGFSLDIPMILSKSYYISEPLIYNNYIDTRNKFYDIKGNGSCRIKSDGLTFDSSLNYTYVEGLGNVPPSQYLRVSDVSFESSSNQYLMSDKLFRVTFVRCRFHQLLVVSEDAYLQSIYLINCLIEGFNTIGSNHDSFMEVLTFCTDTRLIGCSIERSTGSLIKVTKEGSLFINSCLIEGLTGTVVSNYGSGCKVVITDCYLELSSAGYIVNASGEKFDLTLKGNFFGRGSYTEPKEDNTGRFGYGYAKVSLWGNENVVSVGNTGLYDTPNEHGIYFRTKAEENIILSDINSVYNNNGVVDELPSDTEENRRKGLRNGLILINKNEDFKPRILTEIGWADYRGLEEVASLDYSDIPINGTVNGISYESWDDGAYALYVLFNGNPFTPGEKIKLDLSKPCTDGISFTLSYGSEYSAASTDRFNEQFTDSTTVTIPDDSSAWYLKIITRLNNPYDGVITIKQLYDDM